MRLTPPKSFKENKKLNCNRVIRKLWAWRAGVDRDLGNPDQKFTSELLRGVGQIILSGVRVLSCPHAYVLRITYYVLSLMSFWRDGHSIHRNMNRWKKEAQD